ACSPGGVSPMAKNTATSMAPAMPRQPRCVDMATPLPAGLSCLLRGEPLARRGPVDPAVDVMQKSGVAVGAGQMTERRVERASTVIFVVPCDRMKLTHAVTTATVAPVGLGFVGLFID